MWLLYRTTQFLGHRPCQQDPVFIPGPDGASPESMLPVQGGPKSSCLRACEWRLGVQAGSHECEPGISMKDGAGVENEGKWVAGQELMPAAYPALSWALKASENSQFKSGLQVLLKAHFSRVKDRIHLYILLAWFISLNYLAMWYLVFCFYFDPAP